MTGQAATRVDTYQGHRCRCVVVFPSGFRDRCPQTVRIPDAPICDDCEERHRDPEPLVVIELSPEP